MGTVTLETEFLENHLLKADRDYAMVYLCALKYSSSGESVPSAEKIAKLMRMKTGDVNDAINYWKREGFDIFTEKPEFTPNTSDKSVCTPSEIASFTAKDRELAMLYDEAQRAMGKTLSTSDIQTIFWLYDNVGLPAGVIILVINYALRQGKARMRYIEKTAIAWAEKGILTVSDAANYIKASEEYKSYESKIKRIFGLERNFLPSEREIILKWQNEYKPTEEMVFRAYEICIERNNKFSIKYINGIIKNWFEKGFKTINDVKGEKKAKAKTAVNPNSFNNFTQRTDIDYKKIERDALMRKINGSGGDN